MRRLTRYVLAELLKVFLVALASLTTLILLFLVGREAVGKGMGIVPTLRILPYILPEALRYAVPGTMLLAATSVYSRMASSNEVVAVKSAGISPMVLVWPMIVLAALMSYASVWLNDIYVSWGRTGVQRVVIESFEQIVYGGLRTQKSFSRPDLKISVRGVEGRRLLNPKVVLTHPKSGSQWNITADEARLKSNPAEGTLTIEFVNAYFKSDDGFRGSLPSLKFDVDPQQFTRGRPASLRPADHRLSQIPQAIAVEKEKITTRKQEMAATAAIALMTGDLSRLAGAQWQAQRGGVAAAERTLHRLHTEQYRRWSDGFACLCFALIGAPMAIRRPHRDFLASFFVCFLPILLIYYPLLVVGLDQAKSGAWPPQSVWIGNAMLVVWGVWLLRKVVRY